MLNSSSISDMSVQTCPIIISWGFYFYILRHQMSDDQTSRNRVQTRTSIKGHQEDWSHLQFKLLTNLRRLEAICGMRGLIITNALDVKGNASPKLASLEMKLCIEHSLQWLLRDWKYFDGCRGLWNHTLLTKHCQRHNFPESWVFFSKSVC